MGIGRLFLIFVSILVISAQTQDYNENGGTKIGGKLKANYVF